MEPKQNTQQQNTQQQATEGEEQAEERLTRDEVAALVNQAITSHLKRFSGSLEKTIADVVGRTLPTARQADDASQGADEGAQTSAAAQPAKPDPALRKLQEQLEALTKKNEEAEARARATEEKARRQHAHAVLMERLGEKGIKGARARAVIADLETTGALRYDDEGNPKLAVKRVRTQKGPLEELEFDLATGVEDWSKTTDAAEFLPAPTGNANHGRTGAPARPGTSANGQRPKYAAPAQSEEEMLRRASEQLSSSSGELDLNSAYRR